MMDPRVKADEDDDACHRRNIVCKKEGMDDYSKYIHTRMFIAGLHKKI